MSAASSHEASREQRDAADPAASIWVSASAGSGKTRVLIDRLLRLLLGGTPAHRVLCVTFTKAAAAEMAGRLFCQLAEWVVLDDGELRVALKALTGAAVTQDECDTARRLFAQVLDAPGGLKIQTIHALCESLLARFPLEARVPTHFQVLEEGLAIELLIAARDQVLESARTQKGTPLAAAVAMLGEISSENAFADIMRALTNERAKIRKAFEAHGGLEGVVAATRTHLGVGPDETDASVVQAACADGTFDELGLRRIAGAMLAGSAAEQGRATILTDWLAKPKHREAMFEDYVGVTLTKSGTPRKTLATKKTISAQADAADVLGVEASRLMAVAAQRMAVAAAERAEALLVIGEALLGAFEAEKKRHARLDYEDLIVETQRLLRRPGVAPWVLFKLDGGIDHILLDEAQDTSPDQWDIVAALADEFFSGAGAREVVRSVFVVGDEKQSIFSFQGADPDAFDEMRRHFQQHIEGADCTWLPLALTRSYRSAPAVLSVIDKVFEAAGAGVISAGKWPRHLANRQGHGGLVELWPVIRPEATGDDDPWQLPLEQGMAVSAEAQLAGRIAECIGGWLREHEELAARGRRIKPGDVMILVRRRNLFFEEMVRALKQRGIAVAGTDRMVLTQQLAVMDLMALGHFALLPEDDLTLAIVLKTPLFGFDDARLFALADGRGKASLWSTLRRRRGHADDFARAFEALSQVLARADLVPPFDFFAEVLGGGGRERLLGRLGPEADDPIDEFLNRALAFERDHAPSLEGFLHWLETGEAEVKRDLDQGRDEVRVMTVHGAKGLQSPIVFLPDTCAVPPKRESLMWTGDDPPLMLWPLRKEFDDAVTARAHEAHGEAQMAEYRRLLYVAMTRAEDRLYVCSWETTRGRADGCWYDLVAAAMREIGEPLDATAEDDEDAPDTGLRYTEQQSVRPDAAAAPAMAAQPAAMPLWITAPPPPEAPLAKPLAPSRPLEDEPPVQAPLGAADGEGGEPFRRGTILHRLLQFLPDVAPDRRTAAAARYLARPTMGLGDDECAELAAEALAVLAEPAFAEVFAPDALAEAPLAGVVGEFILSGQIDRLAIGETEVLVVDYKTNREPPASEADIPAAYVRQMAAYRAALQAIYPEKSIRCALLWTAAPRLIELSEAALDKAAP